jgi:hypothetical protein
MTCPRWYDVECTACKKPVAVGELLAACPHCGSEEKPMPLPAMRIATKLVEEYMSKKQRVLIDGPKILNSREYAGLLLRSFGRHGALEAWNRLPKKARRRWPDTSEILRLVRAAELEDVSGSGSRVL